MLRLPPSRRPNFKPLNSPPRPLGSRSRSTNTEKVPKDPENEKVLGTAGGDSLDGERTPVGSHEDLEKTPAGSNVDLEKTVVPETIIDEGPIVSVMDDVIAGLDPTVVVDVEKLHDTETKPAVVQPVVGGKKKKKPVNPEDVKMFGRRKAKKIAAGKLVVEDGQTYDMSLLKAMFATVWFKWLLAVAMNASAGESSPRLPTLLPPTSIPSCRCSCADSRSRPAGLRTAGHQEDHHSAHRRLFIPSSREGGYTYYLDTETSIRRLWYRSGVWTIRYADVRESFHLSGTTASGGYWVHDEGLGGSP